MKHTIYDYVIVGSGLGGLAIGAHLSQITQSVAIVEANDTYGGFNRPIQLDLTTKNGLMNERPLNGLTNSSSVGDNPLNSPLNNGLRFLPATEGARKGIAFLEKIIGQQLISGETENSPVSYEAGGFKPFVGFGDNPPEFYDELLYFTHHSQLVPLVEIHQWPKLLFEKFKGEFFPRSYVTRFHLESSSENKDSDDTPVTHLTINGSDQKTLKAKNYIYCGTLKDLAVLLPPSAFSAKTRSKLKKDTYWTTVCLDIVHASEVTKSDSIHVLNGTTQDELGPCVGRFLPPYKTFPQLESEGNAPPQATSIAAQASQWVTFLDESGTSESELVAHALKKIKRQIKRAYPEALEKVILERIFVAQNTSGDGNLKLSSNQSLPGISNFYVGCGASFPGERNLVATLNQVEKLLSSLAPEYSKSIKKLSDMKPSAEIDL